VLLARPVILVDTREQDPWTFEALKVSTKRGTLKAGDYSVKGCASGGIAVERKSVADLFGTMTSGRIRFEKEMARLSEFRFAALVVEGSVEEILRGSRFSRIHPARMLDTLHKWCVGYRVHPVFCSGRAEAEDRTYRLLKGFWELRGGGGASGA
jgi:DNA excision repair protein ERCC-4